MTKHMRSKLAPRNGAIAQRSVTNWSCHWANDVIRAERY